MRNDRERLVDILEAVERINRYAGGGRERFDEDELVQVWIVHHIQLIGEAARSLSDSFKSDHDEIPWRQIIGMRHILVHQYFGIDREAIWSVVEDDVPTLADRIRAILLELDEL